jgi:rRNA maturation RNase YbeY
VIKNLVVNNSSNYKIEKSLIHKIIRLLRDEFNFNISSLLINFVTSDQIIQINKKFLNHSYSTDIITFDYSSKKDIIESEIYISADDADYNSKKYGVTFVEEILRLVIHGILHLLGYDDQTLVKRRKMKEIENILFQKYSKIIFQEPNA